MKLPEPFRSPRWARLLWLIAAVLVLAAPSLTARTVEAVPDSAELLAPQVAIPGNDEKQPAREIQPGSLYLDINESTNPAVDPGGLLRARVTNVLINEGDTVAVAGFREAGCDQGNLADLQTLSHYEPEIGVATAAFTVLDGPLSAYTVSYLAVTYVGPNMELGATSNCVDVIVLGETTPPPGPRDPLPVTMTLTINASTDVFVEPGEPLVVQVGNVTANESGHVILYQYGDAGCPLGGGASYREMQFDYWGGTATAYIAGETPRASYLAVAFNGPLYDPHAMSNCVNVHIDTSTPTHTPTPTLVPSVTPTFTPTATVVSTSEPPPATVGPTSTLPMPTSTPTATATLPGQADVPTISPTKCASLPPQAKPPVCR